MRKEKNSLDETKAVCDNNSCCCGKGCCCKKCAVLIVAVVAFVIGVAVCALSDCCSEKIAVVNLNAVVSQSPLVSNLKQNYYAKTAELSNWLQTVQKEVDNEQDKTKKEELLKKYNTEFADKKAQLNNEYNSELQNIDKNISGVIAEVAEKKGYKMVITNTNVVYGGDDITEDVVALVK
ncbi:MAG: OmpH family outer membrane protein [Alphaproteobacteria bacterium]|nr:OmpH family outer membrane protein [Alphaproteobacteria bacterium]